MRRTKIKQLATEANRNLVLSYILKHGPLKGKGLGLWATICRLSKKKGYCWMAQENLAEEIDAYRQSVNRLLSKFEAEGWVLKRGRSGYRTCRLFPCCPQRVWQRAKRWEAEILAESGSKQH